MNLINSDQFKGLSVRSANVLIYHYMEKLNSPFTGMNNGQIRYRILNDIENGKLNLLLIKNCGPKCAKEITEWCHGPKVGLSLDEIVEAHMNQGTDENDPYWKLFECKNAVNDAIVEAYKLGFKRGLVEGRK